MDYLVFFFLILFIPLITIRKRKDDDKDIFDSAETTCLKGVLCLYVMFHNLGLDYYHNMGIRTGIFDTIAEHTGGIGVGLFFFLSAFGIVRSYQKHGNKYLTKLLFVHIPKIYLTAVLINCLIYFTYFRGKLDNPDLILRLLNLDLFNHFRPMNRHGWYIASIIALYLIFALVYFIFSKTKIKHQLIVSGIVLAAIALGCKFASMIAGEGGMYVREITLFSTGVLYATFYDQANAILKKFFWAILPVSFALMAVGFFFAEPLATHMASLFIVTCAQKITWRNNVTRFLGKICLGVYLHLYFSTLVMQPFIDNGYYWMLTNAGLILLLSLCTYGLTLGVEFLITRFAQRFRKKEPPVSQA